jgi:hypothetical protein
VSADHVCRVIYDDEGNPIARADATDEELRAVRAVVEAAVRYLAERDAADPEGAAERGRRQEAAIARVRARTGLRGAE